jgi:hypothetical protein
VDAVMRSRVRPLAVGPAVEFSNPFVPKRTWMDTCAATFVALAPNTSLGRPLAPITSVEGPLAPIASVEGPLAPNTSVERPLAPKTSVEGLCSGQVSPLTRWDWCRGFWSALALAEEPAPSLGQLLDATIAERFTG